MSISVCLLHICITPTESYERWLLVQAWIQVVYNKKENVVPVQIRGNHRRNRRSIACLMGSIIRNQLKFLTGGGRFWDRVEYPNTCLAEVTKLVVICIFFECPPRGKAKGNHLISSYRWSAPFVVPGQPETIH